MGLFQKIFGTYSERELKSIYPIADQIEALADEYKALSDAELQAKTPAFKERLANGETLDDILPEAFATVREAADRVLGLRPYRVQLIGGIVLHQGRIAEMKTGEKKEKGENRASDTMGMKHFVRFGLYEIKGSINVQLAEKTGFSEEDADTVKECLRTLFVNDASSARPDGSMEVVKLFWWRHSCKDGQYSSAKVHRSVKVALRDAGTIPTSADDYVISLEALPGLEPEVIDGV